MASQVTAPPKKPTTRHPSFTAPLLAVIVLAALAVLFVIAERQWPFTHGAVVAALQQQSGTTVKMAHFRQTYFPHPGCVAEGVTFRRDQNQAGPPLISVQKLTIVGSYPGLFLHRIEQVRAEGMHVVVPAAGESGGTQPISLNSGTTIGELIVDGAQLEITSATPGKEPLVFLVQRLSLGSISNGRPFSYRAQLKLPKPRGDVGLAGQFGPWKSGEGGQTPLSGSFTFTHADLSTFSGISGILSAQGKFDGVLQHVNVTGDTDIPDFTVTRNQHPVHLTTRFQALVDGLNGDVDLQPVVAHWGKTTVIAHTVVIESQSEDSGKTVVLNATSNQARIEDLLRLFTSDDPPPMLGNIVFRAKVTLPPENRPFLDKVQLQGDFGIAGGHYSDFETQKDVDTLSARARGEADKVEDKQDKDPNYDPGRVMSNVKGHVVLHRAIATLNSVSFDVPGASAVVSGTYFLKSERINLRGPVHLDSQLSKATTGVKSFLLKLVQPLAHQKRQKGSVVEVKITGTYHNPSFNVVPIVPSK